MSHRRHIIYTVIGTTLAFALVHLFPAAELKCFAQGSARIASLLTGAPMFESEHGWVLPFVHQPTLVSTACSGATFFIISAALLSWHSAQRIRSALFSVPLALGAAFIVTIGINALRIICLVQAHRWLIPLLPDNYSAFAHMLVGVAVFLPALIALNALLEFYGYSKSARSA